MTQTPTNPNAVAQPHEAPQAGHCGSCGSVYLRRSKWRQGDGAHLLMLQLPVRCMTCLKREHISLWRARKAMPAKVAHSGEFSAQTTWQDFTTADATAASVASSKRKDAA